MADVQPGVTIDDFGVGRDGLCVPRVGCLGVGEGGTIEVVTLGALPSRPVELDTDRLLLRPWRVVEAGIQRELWTERDPRVPPHRRIDADGHPTIDDLEVRIIMNQSSELLAVERKDTHDVIGYCGLINNGSVPGGESELAFELLRRVWNQGYATEAAVAVLDWAKSSGHRCLGATVWDWNTASIRVLAKVGFTESGRVGPDGTHGKTLFMMKRL